MKKLILSLLMLCCVLTTVTAQESSATKETLIVDYLTIPKGIKPGYRALVDGIRANVIAEIIKTNKVNVIDVATEAFFQDQMDAAASEDALNSAFSGEEVREAASKQFGAKYALQGNISHMNGVRGKLEDGTIYYTGELSISFKVINLVDGTLVHADDYKFSGITAQTSSTPENAVNKTSDYAIVKIPNFIRTAFPTTGKILDVVEVKKGEAKSVYIDLGENVGIKKGDKFDVFQVKKLGERTTQTEVGSLSVTEVAGVDVSVCKVSKCGALVVQSLQEGSGVVLVLKSAKKSEFGATMGAFGKGLLK